ncbi:MAG: hypothetical protein ABH869_06450 [Candidatus Omnitrophota bacterium]
MKNRLAVKTFLSAVFLGILFILSVPISRLLNIDIERIVILNPGIPIIFTGVYISIISIITFIFQNEVGMWSANSRKWISNKCPVWEKMSGLPEEKVQKYFSLEFNRKMVMVGAIINFFLGLCLTIMGVFVNVW